MTNVQRSAVFFITIAILAGLGVWQLLYVNPGLGAGLIGATIGASVARYLKQKRIKELQAKGLNPYDERAFHIAGKASYATLVSGILLAALVVLIGSIFAPVMTVNPFDLLGYCIAIVVLLYVVFYYYYNRKL
ncbi:Protein of unknown function DUF2178, transmembrane [Syntrophomonas zehnderi OL-4]|uniref:DUF2178 domain-containing protein n=1 Tax=Syntrophomonas zehnderi OL-4 TaxID=690567 RepID=A0A0E4C905_9FIRM|nr:DUF2178 domain-containing protein [Syntrophomonas zehnderi]CFX80500.1 Protein of unknown function DUF2178, transmembrane [Syntrophomonas zehnderi OL-4]